MIKMSEFLTYSKNLFQLFAFQNGSESVAMQIIVDEFEKLS